MGLHQPAIALRSLSGHAAPVVFLLMAKVVSGLRSAPEADLLSRLARGEPSALRALYDIHSPTAMAVAQRVLRNPSEAEEVVQETFVELWKRATQYDASRGGAQAWILTIARTRAIDRLRSRDSAERTAHAAAAEPEPARAAVPLELAEQRQDRDRVNAALDTLPPEQRSAIELAYFEGLTQREISERTDTPLGTVKTRVRLALEKLASALQEQEGAK